jgi:hypothetical protein
MRTSKRRRNTHQRSAAQRRSEATIFLSVAAQALQAAGATSLRAIAAGLNEQGIPTAKGNGQWSAVQVARVLERVQ